MRIDIISDTVCPWCYVGKRHLEAALAQCADVETECHWQPFQLNPDMPPEGADRRTYWREKFGSEARIAGMIERLQAVGAELELDFDFEAIERQPSTLKSHALIHALDGDWARQNALKEAILKGFFMDGRDIGDESVLVALAESAGMDSANARRVLADDQALTAVRQLDQHARQMGVTGVPTFIFDGRTALVGAQPAEALVQAIREQR